MKETTKITRLGRDPDANFGVVNTPVYHASTIVWPNLEHFEQLKRDYVTGKKIISYGLHGTPTQFSLESALAELEGGYDCRLFSTGLAANVVSLLTYLNAGDHVLVPDSVYGPVRGYCSNWLPRFGMSAEFYDPSIGADIKELMKENTRVVLVESPGSITFEIQDIPAIAKVARDNGAVVIMDNSWGTPLHFKPFDHGVNVSVQALTKYIVGHSDAMLGAVICDEEHWTPLKRAASDFGQHAAPDDVYLALRGLRTMDVRLKRHEQNAYKLAEFLQTVPEVDRILHPGLPSCPGHEIWQRDFTGACGLFSVALKSTVNRDGVAAMVDNMDVFGFGASWGGYESLIYVYDDSTPRTVTQWPAENWIMRIHAGLEDADDLIADLEAGFERMRASK